MYISIAILIGVLLDFMIGDPLWLWHPVIGIGKLIHFFEKFLRKIFPKSKKGERIAGTILWFLVVLISGAVPLGILILSWNLNFYVFMVVMSIMCFQIMATKSLKDASMQVYRAVQTGDITKARKAVSMIVGRDTASLSMEGVTKAAVETVAENASDGCIAPLFYLLIGGPVLGFIYKAINTMDSMIAYKNDKYLHFGFFAAKMDDVANFIPARICALLMIAASFFCRFDAGNAWRIFKRDRKKSPSPNSAQTESVCAGALGVTLLGDMYYFGKLHKKEAIGDANRPIEAEDIRRTNRLLYVVVVLGVVLGLGIRTGILVWCRGGSVFWMQ